MRQILHFLFPLFKKKNIFFSLFLFPPFLINSQVNDAGLWLSANTEKNINGLFSIYINPQVRLSENYSQIGTYFFDTGLSYEVPSINLKFTGSYRLAQKRNLNESYSIRHRFYSDLNYKLKAKKFAFSYRLRYQHQFKDINRSNDWQTPSNYLRNKFSLKFKPEESLRPFVFIDSWYRLSVAPNEFDNVRFGLGFDYELDKFQSITPSFFIDKEFHVNNPFTSYIIGVDYSYSF